eukprot:TRINITY_DN80424_c0_g1_i1.p1 TRINITY_DN80424_c0_g1~~TRINITY_DN80424_c0_g1_i1.p1  ORF type:complete len:312 (+),score=27.52 TRINITY_DN80424_c0_g1_i1:139-936(+)
MTLTPSLLQTAVVPRGHCWHTQNTPPRSLSLPTVGAGVVKNNPTAKVALLPPGVSVTSTGRTLEQTLPYASTGTGANFSMMESTLLLTGSQPLSHPDPNHEMQVPYLPTKGHASSDHVYRTWNAKEWSKSRTRTEWLTKSHRHDKVLGEIRNIRVLGMIGESLVVAYQGKGRIRTFIDNGSSLELQEIGDGENKRDKLTKYVDGHNHVFRFAEYAKPNLPTKILIMGHSEPDGESLLKKPPREAVTKARVAVSGHVTHCQSFLLS